MASPQGVGWLRVCPVAALPPDPDPRRWARLARRTLVDRWWMTLHEDRVRLPSGVVLDAYHVARLPDWAGVLAVTDRGEAVLVEQYRYGIDRTALELPAGVVDRGETPLRAAQRELREETGYGGGRWTALGPLAVEPGRHTSEGHLFVATGVARVGEPETEATEDLAVRLVDAATLPERVASGEIVHGLHAAAVFWAAWRGLLPGAATGAAPNPSRTAAFSGSFPTSPSPMADNSTHGGTPADGGVRTTTTEQQTLLVSVAADASTEESARMKEIGAKIGDGWRVIQAIPVSGEEAGPGGASEDFMRYQVTVQREIDADNVVVGADRGGAAGLADVGQVSAAFDGPLPDESDDA